MEIIVTPLKQVFTYSTSRVIGSAGVGPSIFNIWGFTAMYEFNSSTLSSSMKNSRYYPSPVQFL
jgi:hypothetical protein